MPYLRNLASALAAITLTISPLGCSDEYDENGKPTLDGTGHQDPLGKADALNGRRGPSTSWDNRSTQVWPVSNRWDDTDTGNARMAGIAWDANSGLSWDEKYRAWVDSLERDGNTFILSTPWGKTIGSPALECAEMAMFLRITFASWYELPFFIEAWDGGRVFFGHMGIVNSSGSRWNNLPRFRDKYADFSHMADEVRANPDAWPRDTRLRNKKIIGNADDSQPAIDSDHAGAFFDEIFLNKRVGYFLALQLGFNGSIHLADHANTYNLEPDQFGPGDFLVERFAKTGIGHTIVIKEVANLGTVEFEGVTYNLLEPEVISGTMPRRQGHWEGPSSAKAFYFTNRLFGGESSVEFGAGLKRFRSPRVIGGKWANSVLPADSDRFINSNAKEKLARRTELYEHILAERTPEERMAEVVTSLEFQREHIRNNPSSCAARTRREDAFEKLYEIGEELFRSKDDIDAEFRSFEDYVFAELVYDQSKTCCWNSSTREMYDAVMLYNECATGQFTDATVCETLGFEPSCEAVRVFKAYDDSGDGFEEFRRFAEANGFAFVPWSADESCPQAGVSADTLEPEQPSDRCDRPESE